MNKNTYKHSYGNVTFKTFISLCGGIDVQLMVTDLETNKILFANEKMNKSYNIDYNPLGKYCWEVYQTGQTAPCDFCPLETLKANPDEPIVWEAYNTLTGRWFRNTSSIIEWTDGQKAHLQQGVDITEMKEASDTLLYRLDQQKLMSKISQSFISSGSTEDLIRNAFEMVGDFLSLDRILLAQVSDIDDTIRFSQCWLAPGAPETSDSELSRALNDGKVKETFLTQKSAYTFCNDTSAAPASENLQAVNISAHLSVPVWVEGRFWGMISYEMCRSARSWTESDIHLARMVSHVISGVIQRNEMLEQVRQTEIRTQSALRKAKERAEESARAKSNFLANMSHSSGS